MAQITVDGIMSGVAAVVDQDENTANLSTTDYSLRLKYINMAVREWAEVYDWQALFKEYNMLVSTSTGNASVVLPADFRKLASFPQITWDGSTTNQFPEILPQQDGQFNDTDKRVWILGNPASNYVLRIFGATLVSGASVKIPYYSSPVSLVSPANITEVPNPDYLVQRVIAVTWEAREDPRFPQAKADADRILRNMLEYENTFNYASNYDRVKTVEETKHSDFRPGRD